MVEPQRDPDTYPAALNGEPDALRLPRRLVVAGFFTVAFLASGLLVAALDAVRQVDDASIATEVTRAERALALLTADGTLSGDDVLSLERDFLLADARVVDADQIGDHELSIRTSAGSDAGQPMLAWTPRRFGSETFARLAPRRIIGILFVTSVTGGIFFWLSRIARDLDRRRREMRELASHDVLTGLANRLHFDEELRSEFGGDGPRQPFALLCLDLDGFKAVNDKMGHAAGDQLLRSIGERLKAMAAPGDLVARLGGDEFAIIRRSALGEDEVAAFARSTMLDICSPHQVGSEEISVGVSIGIAFAPEHARSAEELMLRADVALYQAKAQAGPAFILASPERPFALGSLTGKAAA